MVDQLGSSEERLSRASLVPVFRVSIYTQTVYLVDRLIIPPWEELHQPILRVEPSGRLAQPLCRATSCRWAGRSKPVSLWTGARLNLILSKTLTMYPKANPRSQLWPVVCVCCVDLNRKIIFEGWPVAWVVVQ